MIDFKKELNAEQYQVVTEADGPCLVLAGAGSGKTRTIVYRVAYLIEKGIKPDNILLLTFTNKAAREMLKRVNELIRPVETQNFASLQGGTFHHIANKILRKFASLIGYKANFTILDEEDSESLLKICLRDLNINTKERRYPTPAVLKDLISYAKNSEKKLKEVVEMKHPRWLEILPQLEKIARSYEERKRQKGLMDFDDLLTNLLYLLKSQPVVKNKLSEKFKYILVDEYQDTNKIQAEIIKELAVVNQNVLVVGDDAQSIYSFRAADIKNILDFPKIFKGTKIFHLTKNYRSTPEILNVANSIIEKNLNQFPKNLVSLQKKFIKPILATLASPGVEAEYISELILELRNQGISLDKIAVLFRATYHSQPLEFELTKRDIPYDYRGGLRFFERAHIKDVLAFLKIINNVKDEVSWFRLLNLQIGIGEVTSKNLITYLTKANNINSVLKLEVEQLLTERAKSGWGELKNIFLKILKAEKLLLGELIRKIIKSSYQNYLELNYPNYQERLDDLEQLSLFADRYQNLNSFLAEITMQENFSAARLRTDYQNEDREERIILSTIHQAKGLEWEAVFVINLTEDALPNPRALKEEGGLEEERRLFYVAVTRAQKKLFLTYPLTNSFNSYYLKTPSPFLKEIPEELLEEIKTSEENNFNDSNGKGISYLPEIDEL